jgi:thiamine-phosphate pyrophosphorylase
VPDADRAEGPAHPLPALHAIVDTAAAARSGWTPAALARAYLAGGARCLQVRAKGLSPAALLDLCDEVVAAARACGAMVIVNDRADLAAMAGAGGVHVGQDDLPPVCARAVMGSAAVVGLSTHTPAQVEAAAGEPISYVAVGPVFETATKDTGYAARGLALVGEAAGRAGGRPVVAIGGITLARVPAVIAAGASGVAVIGDLLSGTDPVARVAAFVAALDEAARRGEAQDGAGDRPGLQARRRTAP